MNRIAILIVLSVIASLIAGSVWADRPPATVAAAPSSASIAPGETLSVDFRVVDAQELYAFELYVDYDPDVLSVVDADGFSANGVQVQLGDFLSPDLVITNHVDEVTGGSRSWSRNGIRVRLDLVQVRCSASNSWALPRATLRYKLTQSTVF